MNAVAHKATVLQVQIAESLNHLESEFRLEGAKVSKEMKKTSEDCIVAHIAKMKTE